MKGIPHPARDAEIMRRRAAGETCTAIGLALGMNAKSVQSTIGRMKARGNRPAKMPKDPRPKKVAAAKPVVAVVSQPAYAASQVRQVQGYGPALRTYVPPTSLRLNSMRAAAEQAPIHSMGSSAMRDYVWGN